jgi:hypothetical protein
MISKPMNMKKLLLLLLILILVGCKKKSESTADYSCNCQPYGKNWLSLAVSGASSLYPFHTSNFEYGYLGANGDTVISAQFAGTSWFSNHRGFVIDDKSGMQFAGFIDETGTYVIQPHYRYLVDVFFSAEGLIPIGNKDNYLIGYIDKDGQQRVPYIYNDGSNFREGCAVVVKGDSVGVIDVNGNVIVPIRYKMMGSFSEGLAFAREYGQSKAGYIDKTGKFKFRMNYMSGGAFMYGLAPVIDSSGKYGYIDLNGNTAIPAKFSDASVFSENLAAARYEGKWGFLALSGSWYIPPQFDDVVVGFCNGLAAVKNNSQWGYVNTAGTMVIPYQFDRADVFYCDLAKVQFMDATTGYVNKKGKVVYHSKSSGKEKNASSFISDRLKEFTTFAGKE